MPIPSSRRFPLDPPASIALSKQLPILLILFTRVLCHAVLPEPESLTGGVLGDPPAGGSFSYSGGTFRIQAQGAGIGDRGDHGYFAHAPVGTDPFDVRVRVRELTATALSARAGLMVRGATNAAVGMAAIVVTPGMNGIQFMTRSGGESVALVVGNYPGNLPHAWLRLQRTNDAIRGLASLDGRRWSEIGRISLTLTNALLGVAASSARTGVETTATFSDWGEATGDSEDPMPPPMEPAGPSSRRTALVITEINYNPPGGVGVGERPRQFVEVFNSDFTDKELGGHRVEADAMRYAFPTGFVLRAGAMVVIAKDPAELRAAHPSLGAESVLGPWEGDLDRNEDTVRLWSPFGALVLEIPYKDHAPWPLAADGMGHTLVLARPSWGEADPRAWAPSQQVLGSPGRADAVDGDVRSGLRITEVLARAADGIEPFIEVFNAGVDSVPLTGIVVTGSLISAQPGLPLPAGTLASGARIRVEIPPETSGLPSPMFLRDSAGGRVWDAVAFRGSDLGVPLGRIHLDVPELRWLTAPTPGLPNAAARAPRIVISEVMYKPISGRDDDQYLELWNPGAEPVPLAGWRLAGGVTFDFPAGRSLAPGERAVVARNSARLQLTHTRLSSARILGEFSGRLAGNGERLTLLDATGAVEFGFTFRPGGEWPSLPDGGGSSLELLHPELDPDLGSSWAASDESGRAPWRTYEVSGLLEGGVGSVNDVRVLLLGAGETLVDDVEVFAENGTNLLANPDFEGGMGGWFVGGTHEKSELAIGGGFGGSAQALLLRASGRGDNGINSVRAPLRTGLRSGTNTTLRLRARWLAGARDLLLRVKGNYLELPVRLEVPEDLGTPGLSNSRSLPGARPALTDLSHFPVLPADGQPVRVTVRIVGHPGADLPMLRYRIDPSTSVAEPLPMTDAGTDGDLVPGDGIYTAVLPGRSARSMAAFHVTLGPDGSAFRLPRVTPDREALVRWGEFQPAGNLGTYRLWITRATESRWNSRPKLHNGDLDATFVVGSTRAMYGVGSLYSGSPFVSPGYNGPAGSELCGYVLHFQEDDAFLGERDFVMDWPIRDTSRQLEQRAYEFAAEIGLPYLHRRFVHMFVNSSKRSAIYEDTQQPGGAYLRNWSPDDNDGNLHKIEDWFEFTTAGEREFNEDARLEDFRRSDGSRNTARYRWGFRPRSVEESAHDFDALFRLVDAAVPPTQLLEFQRDLEREIDMDEWAGVFAVEHAVGNWDSFGYSRGKNMYAYKPRRGPWRLHMWDIDFVMSAGGDAPGNWPFATIDSTIAKLYQHGPFQRAYWRAVKKLVNGPMVATRFNARTEAVRLGLVENGVSASQVTSARNYVRDQRASLLSQLAGVDRPFTVESSLVNGSTSDPVLGLQGQGALEMTGLLVNDEIVPVVWFTPDRWFATVPLQGGRNQIRYAPVDATGKPLGAVRTLAATLSQPPLPEGERVVFHEIHASPKEPGAAFVELFNPSSNQSFDLSGLQLTGAGAYEFPPNTFLSPQELLVLGTSIPGFQAEFGRLQIPRAILPWTPSPLGETLALVRPARGTNPAETVTAVTYRNDGPWPAVTRGRSLQLRNPTRGEDDRVGAWGVYSPPTNSSAWKEFSVAAPAGGTNLLLYVSSFPPSLAPRDLAGRWVGNLSAFQFDFATTFSRNSEGTISGQFFPVETAPDPELVGSELADVDVAADGAIRFVWTEIAGQFRGRIDATGMRATGTFTFENGSSPFVMTRQLPAGTVLVDDLRITREGDTSNLLPDGDFQSELGPEWRFEGRHQQSGRVASPDPANPGGQDQALRVVGTVGGHGAVTNAVSRSIAGVEVGVVYRLTGRYQAVEAQGLFIGFEDGPRFAADLRPRTGVGSDATPGRPNSNAEPLALIPLVWLNEVQPENPEGLRDASGKEEPWIEIHNSGILPASLDGYFLTDDPSAPFRWAFPPGSSVPSGGFLIVWLDGQPGEGTPNAPHAGFRPAARDGVIILSRLQDGGAQTVDFLRYAGVEAGRTFGHLPETWVHSDDVLHRPTPGAANGSSPEPERIWINEWMAANGGSVRDPADLDSDDWFELHNPGSTSVDLEGWFLSDTADNPTKFRVPAGYRVPPGGFLVVWADEESGQNRPELPDLHVNFRLATAGEEILLLRPDGTVMDRVVFRVQTTDVSQGRRPDGAPGTEFVFFAEPTPGGTNLPLPSGSPVIVSVERLEGGSLRVRFQSDAGAQYRLRAKNDLNQATWTPSVSTITADSLTTELVWPADGAPQRFVQVERIQ
ncbi:MAG: lamin tail domain-containing protein [Limisphaerales bacterium]